MLKKIISLSVSYSFIEAVSRLSHFLFLAWLAHLTSTSEFGQISIMLSFVALAQVGLSLSVESSLARFYFRFQTSASTSKKYIGASFHSLLVISSVMLIVSMLVSWSIHYFFGLFEGYVFAGFVGFLISFLQIFCVAFFALLKAEKKLSEFSFYYISFFLLKTIVPALFVYFGHGSVFNNFLLGWLCGMVLSVLLMTPPVLRRSQKFKSTTLTKIHRQYGLQVLPVNLSTTMNRFMDRYIILHFIGLASVGVYTAGYQLGQVLLLIATALNTSYAPFFFELYEKSRKTKVDHTLIQNAASFIILIMTIALSFWVLIGPSLLGIFFGEKYFAARAVIPYISLGCAMTSIYFINTNALSTTLALNRVKIIGILLGVVANIGVSFTLTPLYGIIGPAIGSIVGLTVTICYFGFMVCKETQYRFNNLRYFLAMGSTFGLGLYLHHHTNNSSLIYSAGILALCLLIQVPLCVFLLNLHSIVWKKLRQSLNLV